MNLRHIQQFIAVIEQGSIGQAARQLHLSQPALTKSLHQLELDMKVPLLDRTRSGTRPTVFGKSFYEHAKRIESELARAKDAIEVLRGAHQGSVSVGVMPVAARCFLPDAIVRLARTRPGITVSVAEKHASELMAAYRKGEYDFIIGILDDEEPGPGDVAKLLFHDELTLALRAGHPLTELKRITPKDLTRFPWIYPKAGTARRRRMDDFFRAAETVPPIAAVEGAPASFAISILLQSDLLAVLPEHVLRTDKNAAGLASITLSSSILRRPIGILHHGASGLSPAARALVAEIARAVKLPRAA